MPILEVADNERRFDEERRFASNDEMRNKRKIHSERSSLFAIRGPSIFRSRHRVEFGKRDDRFREIP